MVMLVIAERARRGDLGDAGNFAKPPLQRRGDRRRHDARVGAGPAGRDTDGRELDGRHARHRQEAVGHRADQEQADRQQRGADRAKDERDGEVHRAPHSAAVRGASRLAPDRRDERLRPDQPPLEALHQQIDHRRGVEREQLAQQQAADDGDAERVAQLRAGAAFERERHGAEQRGQRRHHDRAGSAAATPARWRRAATSPARARPRARSRSS